MSRIFAFPHGFYLDHEGFLWVTEGGSHGDARATLGESLGLGHQVLKLNQRGEVVMRLGEAGVWGDGPYHFNGPSGVAVAGNGDIWESWDALRMMRATGCDGVVVGRGCLGRPWLFRDLADVFEGRPHRDPPRFGEVADIMLRHATRLAGWFGEEYGIRSFRRQSVWYTKGFPGSSRLREKLIRVTSLAELAGVVSEPDPELEFPPAAMRMKRGKSGGSQRVSLPSLRSSRSKE